MDLQRRSGRQKLLLIAFAGYAVNIAMLVGMGFGIWNIADEMNDHLPHWLIWAFILSHGLLLMGLYRPEKRKKLLLLAVLAQCLLNWYWYYQQVGDILYALMSFPINLIAEALLISYIMSTKRGRALRMCTVTFLVIRVIETAAYILQVNDGYLFSIWLIFPFVIVLVRYGALISLVFGLGTKGKAGTSEDNSRLDSKFLSSVERDTLEKLCLFCGESNPYEGTTCKACGKELREERSLFENFPDESGFSSALRNAYDSLKKQDWTFAKEICEKAINEGENSPWAYTGMLLADLQYESFSGLLYRPVRLELYDLWQKAVGAADGETKERLKRIRRLIFNRCEEQRLEKQYMEALEFQQEETAEASMQSAEGFARISGYRDAQEQAQRSLQLAQERVYNAAMREENAENWSKAQQLYESIPEWQDAAEREKACRKMKERTESVLWNCGAGKKLGIAAACVVSALVSFLVFRI